MSRYVWSMDDKVLAESDKILVKRRDTSHNTLQQFDDASPDAPARF